MRSLRDHVEAMRLKIFLLLAFFVGEGTVTAQVARFIEAKVVNADDGQPVSFASISLEGSEIGTAADMNGTFFLKLDSPDARGAIRVSCIGFKSRSVSIDSIPDDGLISLTPEIELLKEVVIEAEALTGAEVLKRAIDSIPVNYNQYAFNMEFYSVIETRDTVADRTFKLETIFESYHDGYRPGSKKVYRIVQKRESGEYFLPDNTQGMSQWPIYEIAANEIFSNQTPYQIFNLDSFEKIHPQLTGVELYDGDTVFVVTYRYLGPGTLYISSSDFAILKHITHSSGRGYENRSEIIFKKQEGKYYPYVAYGDYLHRHKVDGKNQFVKVTNRTTLRRIRTWNVDAFDHRQELLFPKNVAYDRDWWRENFPE